jgi:hypothetical protein
MGFYQFMTYALYFILNVVRSGYATRIKLVWDKVLWQGFLYMVWVLLKQRHTFLLNNCQTLKESI